MTRQEAVEVAKSILEELKKLGEIFDKINKELEKKYG